MFLWHISEEQIEAFLGNGPLFHKLVTDLIRSQGLKSGIPESAIITTSQSKTDEGVDLQIDECLRATSNGWHVIPCSIWQFKAERPTSSFDAFSKNLCADIDKLIDGKKHLFDLLTTGKYTDYTVVWAYNAAAYQVTQLEQSLKKCFHDHGFEINTHVINAEQISVWLDDFLPLCATHFGISIGNLQQFNVAVQTIDTTIPFEPDPFREEIVTYIKELCGTPNIKQHLRVEGTTGVGKTRVVFEAIKETPRVDAFFYAGEPSLVPIDLFSQLQRRQQKPEVFIVVDECDEESAADFNTQLKITGCSYLLITINRKADTRYSETEYDLRKDKRTYLSPLEEKGVEKIVRSILGQPVNEAWVDAIVRLSGGFVKIAVILAKEIVKGPTSQEVVTLMRRPEPENALRVLIRDEVDRDLLRFLALFTKLGWDDELASERDAVTKWAKIGNDQPLRDACEKNKDRGLVVKQGRYRYVTPDLLAIWLATGLFKTKTKEEIVGLLQALPTAGSKTAFVERLADLGTLPEAHPAIQELFKIFGTIDDLEAELPSEIFATLTEADQEEGKKKISELIIDKKKQELKKLGRGRSNVVYALQKLSWFKQHFYFSLEALFRLASTEDKASKSAPATSAVCTLFHTHLSGTEVSLSDRFIELRKYLNSEDEDVRSVAIEALESILTTWQTRDGGSERQRGKIIPKEYRPSEKELVEVSSQALDSLFQATNDPNIKNSDKAKHYLIHNGRVSTYFELFGQYFKLIQQLYESDPSQAREMRQALQDVLKYEEKHTTDSERTSIREFIQETTERSYTSKLQRWLGKLTHEDYGDDLDNPERVRAIRYSLADEAIKNKESLIQNIDWLLSSDAQNIWWYAFRIGCSDKNGEFLQIILPYFEKGTDSLFLPGYTAGLSSINSTQAQKLVQKFISEKKINSSIIFDVLWRNDYFDKEWIIANSLKLVAENKLPPEKFLAFRWVAWLKDIETILFRKILETCLTSETSLGAALSLLVKRVKDDKKQQEIEDYTDIAQKLLTTPSVFTHKNQMDEWEWNELAEIYSQFFPTELTKAILLAFCDENNNMFHSDYTIQMLYKLVRDNFETCWLSIGDLLLKKDLCSAKLQIVLANWFTEGLNQDLLIGWAEKHQKENGPEIVARLAKLNGSNFSNSLARKLLLTFPEDKNVESNLISSFFSGGFSGPTSDHTKIQIHEIKSINETSPIVKRTLNKILGILEKELPHDQVRDEEWGFK